MIQSLNGYTFADLRLVAVPPQAEWLDAPMLERGTEAISDRFAHRPAARATSALRNLRVPVRVVCPTFADRAPYLAYIDEALQGVVEIVRTEDPSLVMRGAYKGCTVDPVTVSDTLPDLYAWLNFTLYDGASYASNPVVWALTTTPTPIPQGTLPAAGVVVIAGGWSGTRTVEYRGHNGILYGSISITVPVAVTFAAGEHLVLDLARWSLHLVSAAGVYSSVYSWLSSGDWFVPQPKDCDRANGLWATLAVSAGTAQYIHRPAYRI